MDFHYEIENEKLKKMVEKKAKEWGMSVDRLIWGYINRGLMDDNLENCILTNLSQKLMKR